MYAGQFAGYNVSYLYRSCESVKKCTYGPRMSNLSSELSNDILGSILIACTRKGYTPWKKLADENSILTLAESSLGRKLEKNKLCVVPIYTGPAEGMFREY